MRLTIHQAVKSRVPRRRFEQLMRTARRYHHSPKPLLSELSLVLVGERTIRKLNRFYRGEDKPTDVLSFDYGEIIICYPVAMRQAKEHGLKIVDELSLLFVHGLLHIMGFEHKTLKERKAMRLAEEKLLDYQGLVDRTSIKKNVQYQSSNDQ